MNLKKICATSLALCMTMLLGACRSESDVFPSLKEPVSTTKQTETETTSKEKSGTDGIREPCGGRHNTKGHCHPRALSAKTSGFHTQQIGRAHV